MAAGTPLSVVLMIDASGSMESMELKQPPSDSDGLRKAAAQALVAMLGPEDEVAVVQFSTAATCLTSCGGRDWVPAKERAKLFDAISRIGSKGYTDFRDGLRRCQKAFAQCGPGRRRVVVLLTDGLIDCGSAEASLAARGEILTAVVPELSGQQIEVYTIALGSTASDRLLEDIAEQTSLNRGEQHAFHANRAEDLAGVFLPLLQYWRPDLMVVQQDRLAGGDSRAVSLDRFMEEIKVFAVGQVDSFRLLGPGGGATAALSGTHPALKVYELGQAAQSGRWTSTAAGPCRTLWVGRSRITLAEAGLQPEYRQGDSVTAVVRVLPSGIAGQLRNAQVRAEFAGPDGEAQMMLQRRGFEHRLVYVPPKPGKYQLRLVLHAEDANGQSIFPRPTVLHLFEVMPAFYVRPELLCFGCARRGPVTRKVTVCAGVPGISRVAVASSILRRTNRRLKDRELPALRERELAVAAGQTAEHELTLDLPANSFWRAGGYYEGEIAFRADTEDSVKVRFLVRIPTLWEDIRWWAIGLAVLGLAVVIYFVFLWVALTAPSGVLVKLASPAGDPTPAPRLRLSSLGQRGLREFTWRRNRLTVGRSGTDVQLRGLPPGFRAEMRFYRWGTYIDNQSPAQPGMDIALAEPGRGRVNVGPGRTWRIKPRSAIEFGGYSYRFER